MKQEIFAQVGDEGILIHGKNILEKAIKIFAGQRIYITIEKQKKKRSIPQNRFLWGVVYDYVQRGMQQQGILASKNDVHEFLKHRFLKRDEIIVGHEEVFIFIKSTAELTTSEMMDYIAQIQQFAAEYLGVIVPDPNTQTEIFNN